MDYIPMLIQSITTVIFGVITWYAKRYLAETAEREKKLRDEIMTERRANTRGMQALLRAQLLQEYHFFRRRGMVTYCEAQGYQNMYEAYHDLGKNGVMDRIFKAFQKIPIRPDDEIYPDER